MNAPQELPISTAPAAPQASVVPQPSVMPQESVTPQAAVVKIEQPTKSPSRSQVLGCILLIAAFGIPLTIYAVVVIKGTADEIVKSVDKAIAEQKPAPEREKDLRDEAGKQIKKFYWHIGMALVFAVVVVGLGFGFLRVSNLCDEKGLGKKVCHEFGMALLIAALLLLVVEITIRISEANSTRQTFADFGTELEKQKVKLGNAYSDHKNRLDETYDTHRKSLEAANKQLEDHLKAEIKVIAPLRGLLAFQAKRAGKTIQDCKHALEAIDELSTNRLLLINPFATEAIHLTDLRSIILDNYGHALWKDNDLDGAANKFAEALKLDENRAKEDGVKDRLLRWNHIVALNRMVEIEMERNRYQQAAQFLAQLQKVRHAYSSGFSSDTDRPSAKLDRLCGGSDKHRQHWLSFLLSLPNGMQKVEKLNVNKDKQGELSKDVKFQLFEVDLEQGQACKVEMTSTEMTLDSYVVVLDRDWRLIDFHDDIVRDVNTNASLEIECKSTGPHRVIATSYLGSRLIAEPWGTIPNARSVGKYTIRVAGRGKTVDPKNGARLNKSK